MPFLLKNVFYCKWFAKLVNNIQQIIPNNVGRTTANAVHFQLPVSFFIVKTVVEHGQCIIENIIVFTAVIQVHPFCTNKSFNCVRLSKSVIVLWFIYVIMIIGITISLAGKPSINANNITPSSPINCANGSKKSEQYFNKVISFMLTFAISHIKAPAGAATETALPKTKRVRSKIERTITFPICGFLYGGISSVKEEGNPFNKVFDKIFVAVNVDNIPNKITVVNSKADKAESIRLLLVPIKNIVIIAMRAGNLPLQGTNEFVSIASKRSLGESMILQPTTPAALQPNPIHIVSACLPQALHLLNGLSRLYAILGR